MKYLVLLAALCLSGCRHPILGEPTRLITVTVTAHHRLVAGATVRFFTPVGYCGQITLADGQMRCLVPTWIAQLTVEVRAKGCSTFSRYLPAVSEILVDLVCEDA